MKPRLNKHNHEQLNALKTLLEQKYPNLLVGFYLKNFNTSSMGIGVMGVSATFESQGQNLVWRIYRKSDTPQQNQWDVDEMHHVNKPVMYQPSKKDIPNHHINHSIEEDIMRRNQILCEVIQDEAGNFVLNRQADGMVHCFINFESVPNREGKEPEPRWPETL